MPRRPAAPIPRYDASRADPASAAFRSDDYPFYRLARAAALYAQALESALKPRGMDQPRWRVLMILHEHDRAATGLVAERAVMKLPTVVKLLQRMEHEGYVASAARAADQRVVEFRLTARGRLAVRAVRRVASRVYAQAVAGLAAGELATLHAALVRIERNLLAGDASVRRARRVR